MKMDNERKLILRNKLDMQRAANILKGIDGITVLDIFNIENNINLLEVSKEYFKAWHDYEISPIKKLPKSSSRNELCQWIIENTDIDQGKEYYFLCGGLSIKVWGKIRINKLDIAVESILNSKHNNLFLIDSVINKVYDIGSDSSDEYNYLLYIK